MRTPKLPVKNSIHPVTHLSRKLFVSGIVALLLCWSWPNRAQAAAGDLDLTFGSGGKVTTNFFNVPNLFFFDEAYDVIVQPDGKVIAAGVAEGPGGNFHTNFGLVRYKIDGSLDAGFGSGGKVFTGFDHGATAYGVALQPDGKVIAVGVATRPAPFTETAFGVARYNPDGSLDSSFGTGGLVTTDFANNEYASASAVMVQPDGKIVVAGTGFIPGNTYDFAIARYNADGTLDPSFGVGGKATTNFFGNADQATDAVLQADGKIVVTGLVVSATGGFIPGLARYNTNGTLDTSFGTGGKVVYDLPSEFQSPSALAVQADGKIIMAGNGFFQSVSSSVIVRYNPDGGLDVTFGAGGKLFDTSIVGTGDVVIQPGGKFLIGGITGQFGQFDFGLARYNSDGSLDSGFGVNGRVATDFLGNNDGVAALALQPDGKIVAAGRAYDININNEYFAVARYNGDGMSFDSCVQDESNGNLLTFNSTTGDYQFTKCGSGVVLSGKGSVTRRGSTITLQHNTTSRRVLATVDSSLNRGTASIQVLSLGTTFTIMDRNITNNTCGCP